MRKNLALVEIESGKIFVLGSWVGEGQKRMTWWYCWQDGEMLPPKSITCSLIGSYVVVEGRDGVFCVEDINPRTLVITLDVHEGYCHLDNLIVIRTPDGVRVGNHETWHPFRSLTTGESEDGA